MIKDRPFYIVWHSMNAIKPVILEILMKHGAKSTINQAYNYGDIALHLIPRNLRQIVLVQALLRYGADIKAVNLKEETPLHMAARGILTSRMEMNELRPRSINSTYMYQIKAQEEMVAVLQTAAGVSALDLPNGAGKTSRQVQEEERIEWRTREEGARLRPRGRGRGRG
jgi:ankyrin repeat protein